MASLACQVFFHPIRCSANRDIYSRDQQVNAIKINGTATMVEGLSQSSNGVSATYSTVSSLAEMENSTEVDRQNIPTKKQLVDPYRQGLIIDGGVGYRQTVVIRSYEVGPDKTATLESILNLLQVWLLWFYLAI